MVDVNVDWGVIQADDNLCRFFGQLYGAFDNASSKTKVGTVHLTTSRNPAGNIISLVDLTFGSRRATLYLNQGALIDGKPYNSLIVTEGIAQP